MTAIPGVFSIDEDHYLVSLHSLLHGRLTAVGTEGLPPSRELAWFDPIGTTRRVTATPVSPTIPPLWAPLALPFSLLGWRGLVGLNVLCFLLTGVLVFRLTERCAQKVETPWIALAAFVLGGYSIEYAQGVWPHLLATALTFASAYLASLVRDRPAAALACTAGLLAGLATGVRYQEALYAACVGLGLLLFAPASRWRMSLGYAAGVALPLAASSVLNHFRLGFWNPISKGAGYLPAIAGPSPDRFRDAARMFWAQVVDFSTRPLLLGADNRKSLVQDPATGFFLSDGVLKKAWLQSAPWISVALAGCVAVWMIRRARAPRRERETRAAALVIVATLVVFSVSGTQRHDGLGYNQRYFLELVPLAAVIFAWAVDGLVAFRRLDFAIGALGFAVSLVVIELSAGATYLRVLAWTPLLLALALFAAWARARMRESPTSLLATMILLSIGWSLAVHLLDDLSASRARRGVNMAKAANYARLLPGAGVPAAIFVYWGEKDALGPLLFSRDLVVLDAHNDESASMPILLPQLFAQRRRVFLNPWGFTLGVLHANLAGYGTKATAERSTNLIEILPDASKSAPELELRDK